MSLEGELQLRLRLQGGRIAGVRLQSTRPDVATGLLQGRRRDEVQAAVPLLFSICAQSQAAACRLALASATGTPPAAAELVQARAAIAEEMLREAAWQLLLHQPRWLDENPTPAALAAARAAQAWRWTADTTAATAASAAAADLIATTVFGSPAAEWLQLDSWPAVQRWAAATDSAAARYLQRLFDTPAELPAVAAVPLLAAPDAAWLSHLAAAAAADPAFSRQPLSQGAAAETGALARLQHDLLLGRHAPPAPSRVLARHVARLRELALLLCGRLQPGVGVLPLSAGSGLAWVDNTRGLLVHHVRLDGEHVGLYRIVAPTEWNFHPQGALAAALHHAPAADAAAAKQLALRLINSLDPCVSCNVEVEDA